MRFLATSSDTGVVKEVICTKGTDTSKKDGIQPQSVKDVFLEPGASKSSRICQLQKFGTKYLLATRLGGKLSVYNYDVTDSEKCYDFRHLHTYNFDSRKNDIPISLIALEGKDVVIVAFESGNVYLVGLNNGMFDTEPIKFEVPGGKVIRDFVNDPFQVGIFAFGGHENDVKIIKLFDKNFKPEELLKNEINPKIIFAPKNVKNDHLNMRVPIGISKIKFLEHPEDVFKFITVTEYGQLRMYDSSHGKRPTKDLKLCDKGITNVALTDRSNEEVIVTDNYNLVAKFSLIKSDLHGFKSNSATAGDVFMPTLKLLGKFSAAGHTGTTYGIDISTSKRLLTGGLDRYLRSFDVTSRELLANVYVGVEIGDVLILEDKDDNEAGIIPNHESTSSRNESDDEELWYKLGESRTENIRKKRKT